MQSALEVWLQRFARQQAAEAIEEVKANRGLMLAFTANKAAAASPERLKQELASIIGRFSKRQIDDAIIKETGGINAPIEFRVDVVADYMAAKEPLLQKIIDDTRIDVRNSIRELITSAFGESRTPSSGEIARRIRNQFHGSGFVPGVDSDFEAAPILGSRVSKTPTGTLYAFSSERAQLIARTEMVQAQNTGTMAGYVATGVERIRWLSYRDGRSGRGHDEMYRKTTPVGTPFILPDGTPMRYPGDPRAPIKHTANCRCTIAPVRD